MWCVMNKCQQQLVCYGLYPSSACFCNFLKQEEENKMSACMTYSMLANAVYRILIGSQIKSH